MKYRYIILLIIIILSISTISNAQLQTVSGQLINGRGTIEKLERVRIEIYLNSELIGNTYTDNLGQFQVSVSTNVPEEKSEVIKQYQLLDNYPNPFSPSTNISYSLDKGGFVSLAIFNVLGQRVKTLINTSQPAGFYTTNWDGKDELDNVCCHGIYFYRLQLAGHSETKKMCMLNLPLNLSTKNFSPNTTVLTKNLTTDILEIQIGDRDIVDTTVVYELEQLSSSVELDDVCVHVYPFARTKPDIISLMSGENATDTLDIYFERPIEVLSQLLETEWDYYEDSLIVISYLKVNLSSNMLKFKEIDDPHLSYLKVYFELAPRLGLVLPNLRRGYLGIGYDDTVEIENGQGDVELNFLSAVPHGLTYEDGRIYGTPAEIFEAPLYFELVDEREIMVLDSTYLYVRDTVDIYFNEYAVDILEEYPTDGTFTYSWVSGYEGVTRDLYYKGERVARAKSDGSGSCYCCGLTFEDFFRGIQRLNSDLGQNEDVNNMTAGDMRYFLHLWFVENTWGDGPGVAMEQFGIGDNIPAFADVRKGDYVQLWRTTGSGHSVIFINWLTNSNGDTTGIHYWSTQGSTNGINYNSEYFTGCGGTVNPDIVYFSRIRSPENFTSFDHSKMENYNEIVNSDAPIVPKAFMRNE